MTVEERLQEAGRRRADAPLASPNPREFVRARTRRRWAGGLAVAALPLVVLVAFVVGSASDDESDRDVLVEPVDTTAAQPDATTTSQPDTEPTVETHAGAWAPLEGDPLLTQETAYAFGADERQVLLVLPQSGGGAVSVLVIDSAQMTSRRASDSGLVWRAFPLVGWTGSELIVAGGSNGPGITEVGAAYDPATDTWRPISAPEGFEFGISDNQIWGPGVWTGEELVSVHSGLAYRPSTDSWRTVERPPRSTANRAATAGLVDRVFVWGGCEDEAVPQCDETGAAPIGDGALFSSGSGEWRELPESPLAAGPAMAAALPDGESLLVLASRGVPEATAAIFNVATWEWETVDAPPLGPPSSDSAITTRGDGVYVSYANNHPPAAAGPREDIEPNVAVFDSSSRTWSVLSPGHPPRRNQALVANDSGVLVMGGSGDNGVYRFVPSEAP
jgi:hypothetical protein